MNRDLGAEVRPAFDVEQAAREVRAAVIVVRDAEAAEGRASKAHDGARAATARANTALGMVLSLCRPQWSARGPSRVKGKTWDEWCADQGTSADQARRCMALAGFVERVSDANLNASETLAPTGREAGTDKRPRKTDVAEAVAPLPRAGRDVEEPAEDEPAEDEENDTSTSVSFIGTEPTRVVESPVVPLTERQERFRKQLVRDLAAEEALGLDKAMALLTDTVEEVERRVPPSIRRGLAKHLRSLANGLEIDP